MDALQLHQNFLDLISVQFGTEEEFFRRVQFSFKTEEEQLKATHIFTILDSQEQLRDWIHVYFGLYMPLGNVSQTRDREYIEYSSPVHAMWEVYKAVRDNIGETTPAFTLLSSRDSYKTLSASMLEVLLLLHFRTTIAHCAAQLSQSQKAVGYCSGFKNKIMPYLEFWGWKQISDSKNRIEFITDKKEQPYINIVTLTMSGANCIAGNSIIHMEDGTDRLAHEIRPGDRILTWDYFKQEDTSVEVGDISVTKKPAREIIFEDGSNIVLSDDHLIFTESGWRTADSLRIGSRLKPYKNAPENSQYRTSAPLSIEKPKRTLEQLLYGTLLGDASLQKIPSGKVRYNVSHCEAQLEYLKEIQSVFEANGIKCSIIRDDKTYNGKSTIVYKLFTVTDERLKIFHEEFYGNGKKRVTKEILEKLNYEGIAYWIMDDGSGNRKQVGKRKEHCFTIASCGFTLKENEEIVSHFNNLGYKSTLIKIKNSKSEYIGIGIDLKSSRDLSEKISPYFVKCLRYKLLSPTSNAKRGYYLDSGKEVKLHNNSGNNGFLIEDNTFKKSNKYRILRNNIDKELTLKVKEINILDPLLLLDVHIKTDKHHLKSFYVNGVFVHNSEHTQLLFIDEVDLCDPKAYQQAQLIPGVYQGKFPLKVRLSTRKFAFGMMEKEIQASPTRDERVLIWNILDVAEYCQDSRCKPKEPRIVRYIPLNLPLKQLTEKEYIELEESQKSEFVRIECMAGCGTCPMLSVCKMKLRNKNPNDLKNLWKPIGAVRNSIRGCDVDVAEAELLCNKPSSSGLIYKRFSADLNTLSVKEAYLSFTSGVGGNTNDFDMLRRQLIELDIPIYGGVDWAQSGESAFTIVAELPNGEYWLLDVFGAKDLEPDDLVRLGLGFQNKYNVKKWFVDQAYPAYIKLFKKKGMICPKFTKDVPKGIGNLRTAILDAMDVRRFKIIKTKETQRIIDAFGTYHWKIDQQGNSTEEPDHTEESDIMDSVRYIFQMAYRPSNKGGVLISAAKESQHEIDYYKDKTVFEPGPTNLLEIIQQKTSGQHKIIKGKGLIFSP
jgi:hypothetical protein